MNAAPADARPGDGDVRAIPDAVLAHAPDGEPERRLWLADMARFYRHGWTPARCARAGPTLPGATHPAEAA